MSLHLLSLQITVSSANIKNLHRDSGLSYSVTLSITTAKEEASQSWSVVQFHLRPKHHSFTDIIHDLHNFNVLLCHPRHRQKINKNSFSCNRLSLDPKMQCSSFWPSLLHHPSGKYCICGALLCHKTIFLPTKARLWPQLNFFLFFLKLNWVTHQLYSSVYAALKQIWLCINWI